MRLLLAGESMLVLQGLATLLGEREDLQVCDVVQLREAGTAARRWSPDLVIVETDDVLAIEEMLRSLLAGLGDRSLLLIAPREPQQFLTGLRIGVRGFVGRDVMASELLSCVDVVARGEWGVPRSLVGDLVEAYRLLAAGDLAADPRLSDRERHILALLSQGTNIRAIGEELFLSESTIRTTIRAVAQKLGVRNRVQLVSEALRRGLLE